MKINFRDAIYKSDRSVFRMRDIGMLTGITDADKLKASVHYYATIGVIKPLRAGIYVKDDYSVEELACRVYTPSYVSLETVLCRAGAIFQYSSALTAISYLSRSITVDGHDLVYQKIKNPVLIESQGIRREGNVNIATPERAFLDRLYLSGNYYIDNLAVLDRSAIESLLPIYANKALVKRVRSLLKNG